MANLFTPSFGWNKSLIQQNFQREEAVLIQNIATGGQDKQDNLAWFYEKNDNFSVKITYWVAKTFSTTQMDRFGVTLEGDTSSEFGFKWTKWVWSLGIPNKIKLFVLKACWELLPCT